MLQFPFFVVLSGFGRLPGMIKEGNFFFVKSGAIDRTFFRKTAETRGVAPIDLPQWPRSTTLLRLLQT